MIFDYQASLVAITPDDVGIILRSVIPIVIDGPNGAMEIWALVDTGADHTVLPRFVAEQLAIPLHQDPTVTATAYGGTPIPLSVGIATLSLSTQGKTVSWTDEFAFHESADGENETAVVGHAGFLNYFTATFDGQAGQLTLIPNSDLPPVAP